MNQDALNKFIVEMTNALSSVEGFAKKELPSICSEVLTYHKVDGFFSVFISLVLSTVAFFIYAHMKTKNPSNFNSDAELLWIPISLLLIVSLIMFSCSSEQLFKLYFAPKVFLLEYWAGLVRPHSS